MVLYPQHNTANIRAVLNCMLKLRRGQGLLANHGAPDEESGLRLIEFEEPTLDNGLHKSLSRHPGVLLCGTLRKSSKIQNQT